MGKVDDARELCRQHASSSASVEILDRLDRGVVRVVLEGRTLKKSDALWSARVVDTCVGQELTVVAAVPFTAHEPLSNSAALTGNVALVGRGDCAFTEKAARVAEAGAVAVLVVNTDKSGGVFVMAGPDSGGASCAIPAMMVGKPDGERLRAPGTVVQFEL